MFLGHAGCRQSLMQHRSSRHFCRHAYKKRAKMEMSRAEELIEERIPEQKSEAVRDYTRERKVNVELLLWCWRVTKSRRVEAWK
jgi:hypothetical protein